MPSEPSHPSDDSSYAVSIDQSSLDIKDIFYHLSAEPFGKRKRHPRRSSSRSGQILTLPHIRLYSHSGNPFALDFHVSLAIGTWLAYYQKDQDRISAIQVSSLDRVAFGPQTAPSEKYFSPIKVAFMNLMNQERGPAYSVPHSISSLSPCLEEDGTA